MGLNFIIKTLNCQWIGEQQFRVAPNKRFYYYSFVVLYIFSLGIRGTDEELRAVCDRRCNNSGSRHRRSDHHRRPANNTAAPGTASAQRNAATPPHNCHKRRPRRHRAGFGGGNRVNCRVVEAVKLRREGSSVHRHTTQ